MKRLFTYKRSVAVLLAATVVICVLASFSSNEDDKFNVAFKEFFNSHNARVMDRLLVLSKIVDKKDFDVDSAKIVLAQARVEYKAIEAFVIFFMPGDSRFINKVIIAEMPEDDEIGPLVPPCGLQYLEMLLYNDSAKFFRKKIKVEIDNVYAILSPFREAVSYMNFKEHNAFEAMQMHLIRQCMLAFANFETGESRTGVQETAAMLGFYKEFLQKTFPEPDDRCKRAFSDLYGALDNAIAYLGKVKPGSEPDYFNFYSSYYIPVSEQLGRTRDMAAAGNTYNTTAVNYQIRSVFDPQAFNSFFFLPAKKVASPSEVVELGRTLFFDPALSANNLRACASCHQAGKAFTDGLALSQSFEPGKMLSRNAPTIVNSVYQRKLFHDGRVFNFENQAGQVMSNALEMHNDFSQVAAKLRHSYEYVAWFKTAFYGSDDTIISSSSILTAIAEYERSIVGLNSRFDKTISGREMVMNDDEKKGFNLFMGKGNCASCHFIPLFNGTMPPEYVETEWEIIGVPSAKVGAKRELDSDVGRAGVINVDIFRHAFKVPTMRNVELTGPYMHNGVFRTLEEVIEFYNIGGGIGMGFDVPGQTLPEDSLHLNQDEKFQLIAFLKTLTDTVDITRIPKRLPEFQDNQKLNERPIGGDY